MPSDVEVVFTGPIELEDIENIWPANIPKEVTMEMNSRQLKIVHYPDCQQLILWLPESGMLYQEFELFHLDLRHCIHKCNISDVLNGSIQILIDTLPIVPGKFVIFLRKKDGLEHILYFKKYQKNEEFLLEKSVAEIVNTSLDETIVYRDGYGNFLENEDLNLRESVLKEIADKFNRKLEYESYGRSGKVIYLEGKNRLEFYMEMGGGNCMFYLDIPTEKNWETLTGFSLERRKDIVEFVALNTWRDQGPSTRLEIKDASINYYRE